MARPESTIHHYPSTIDSDSVSPTTTNSTNETEGIWSADIEQSFLEALAIYPPCGRRKIILSDEGKMYGRNELVARYIKIRTGKVRTRKQVSSHLQVLAKRRSKELQDLRNDKEAQKIILDRLKQFTSAEIVSMKIHDEQKKNNSPPSEKKSMPMPKKVPSQSSMSNTQHSDVNRQSAANNVEHFKFEQTVMPALVPPSPVSVIRKRSMKPVPVNTLGSNVSNNNNKNPMPQFIPGRTIYSIINSIDCLHLVSPEGNPYKRRLSDTSSLSCASISSNTPLTNHSFLLPCAVIGNEYFRLYELSSFIELKRTVSSIHSPFIYPYSESSSIYQHELLRLHANDIQMKNLQTFETISIDQISDKFPHYDGLKDLFERNHNGTFFLIKFWADVIISPSILNASLNREESFYTSYAFTSSSNRPIHISTRLCSFGKQVLEKVDISEYPQRDQFDQFIYRFDRSSLCDYMVQFIQKLRSLPNTYMMNSVLEVRSSSRTFHSWRITIFLLLEFYNTSSD